ncbi:helix-turn-helix transcriptional regulator [Fulvivirga sp. 29W222]|uniref:Helix-turn-helix transcriptional regulator n=1 Tax=Fulvivirga marina TaxID=2494733 RepID=A0A937FZH1_9BACT|nr:AraC family transcriptional regulator [Fulvivirga marina]MBL6447702.1 helix-turn-helix transcriptional regulator [Fulvivirga marina]
MSLFIHIKTLLKKNLNKVFLIVPAIIGIFIILGNYKNDLVIFPNHTITTYNDHVYNGTSQLNNIKLLDTSKLIFSYTLRDGFQHPHIGIQFNHPSKPNFDLSQYDYVEVDLQAENSKSIPIIINLKSPDYFTDYDTVRYRPMWYELSYEKDQSTYRLPLSDFRTPNWWYIHTRNTKKDIAPPNYKHAIGLAIQNCQLLPLNQKESMIINSIRFGKSYSREVAAVISILSIFYLLFFLTIKLRKKQPVIFPHKNLDVCNIEDEEARNIISYISENYNNTNLSLTVLQKEFALTETKISSIFKKSCGTTFKKYLNQVRLKEAKRLLKQTDMQIMEIAYDVGYGNVSHFNKVFKTSEGCPPNEYRKKVKKTASSNLLHT